MELKFTIIKINTKGIGKTTCEMEKEHFGLVSARTNIENYTQVIGTKTKKKAKEYSFIKMEVAMMAHGKIQKEMEKA